MDASSALPFKSLLPSNLHKPTSQFPNPRLRKPIHIHSIHTPSRNPLNSSHLKPILTNPNPFIPRVISADSTTHTTSTKLKRLTNEFQALTEPLDKVKRLLNYADLLPEFLPESRVDGNRVMGCTAQVWLTAEMDLDGGRVRFRADSDSEITKGFCSCLILVLDGSTPEDVLEMKTDDLVALNVVGGVAGKTSSRVNTWYNVLISMQKKCRALMAKRDGRPKFEPFFLMS